MPSDPSREEAAGVEAATGSAMPGPEEATRSTPTVVDGTPRKAGTVAGAKPLTRGTLLGRYVVLDRLGAGGMGEVHVAYDPDLNRRVALKVMRPGAAGSTEGEARMLREAQAQARLSHPNVVAVYDVGSVGDRVFIAMELVEGQTLSAWLRETKRSWREIVEAFVAAGKGLAAAHAAGVIHRDFKPGNVLVGADGRLRVMDFGLARADSDGPEPVADEVARGASRDALGEDLTVTGSIMGTPLYMPPEAYRGQLVGEPGDQFSFCVALYQALYGDPPFATEREASDDARWVMREVPRGRGVPAWVGEVVARGLAKAPEARHASMNAVVEALGRDPRRRRWQLAAFAIVALVASGAWGAHRVQRARVVAGCEAEGARIAPVWNDARAAEIGAAFRATGIAYAADTWSRSRARLESYARTWQTTRTGVCKKAEVEDTLSGELARASRACLDEQRDVLDALLAQLAKPDSTVIQNTATASASLPLVEACTDEARQRHQAEPPSDPTRHALGALQARLARGAAARAIGRFDQALIDAQAVVDEATAQGWRSLGLEAKLAVGEALKDLVRDEEARRALEDAFYEAFATSRDELALRAGSALVYVVGIGAAQHEQALTWGRLSQTLADRLGRVGDRRNVDLAVAGLLENLADVHRVRDDFEQARELAERALALKEHILGPDHPSVAKTVGNLAGVHEGSGDLEKALALQARALGVSERALGPDHPDVAGALDALGNLHRERGELARAVALHERALAIFEKALGPDSLDTGGAANYLGIARAKRGELAQAIPLQERALAIFEKTLGPAHPDVAWVLDSLGDSHRTRGDHDRALALYERSRAIREQTFGSEHSTVATSLTNLGLVHRARGDYAQALAVFEHARRIFDKAVGPEHPSVAEELDNLGLVHQALGHNEKALELLERALAIRKHSKGGSPDKLAATRFALARVLWESEMNPARAIQLATATRDAYRAAIDAGNTAPAAAAALAEVTSWLATHAR